MGWVLRRPPHLLRFSPFLYAAHAAGAYFTTMNNYSTQPHTKKENPFIAGVSAVLVVLMVGTAAGFAFGFDYPARVYAQLVTPIIVTAPAPPPPVVTPPPPVIPVVV